MSKLHNIRGLFLEEALLFLLRNSGYETVDKAGNDPTLKDSNNGLNVIGRGDKHQIDAIADFKSSPPFSNPQRLLVEAKCLDKKKKVGLSVIRNAVGVIKDVQEYFVPSNDRRIPHKIRYHYTYGIFSPNKYSFPAEKYAYAHDIYIIPIGNSLFLKPLIDFIYDITISDIPEFTKMFKMNDYRMHIRKSLRNGVDSNSYDFTEKTDEKLKRFFQECKKINLAFIAIAGKTFPILLIPSPEFKISQLKEINQYKVRISEGEWFIESENGIKMFSFDLPIELLNLYFDSGIFNQESALNLKEDKLFELKMIVERENIISNYTLKLDRTWLNILRDRGTNIED